mmetsp:Transcript_1521/g.2550  ORF Transcript_1521/g.2550 Transcript_1521/m.2550 type:complete len:203 (+) Transcript_1521:174-782(+)
MLAPMSASVTCQLPLFTSMTVPHKLRVERAAHKASRAPRAAIKYLQLPVRVDKYPNSSRSVPAAAGQFVVSLWLGPSGVTSLKGMPVGLSNAVSRMSANSTDFLNRTPSYSGNNCSAKWCPDNNPPSARMLSSNKDIARFLLKFSDCPKYLTTLRNSVMFPRTTNMSNESTRVSDSPPQLSTPVQLTGFSSSFGKAYFMYPA